MVEKFEGPKLRIGAFSSEEVERGHAGGQKQCSDICDNADEIARGLTEAQREAVMSATFVEDRGAWFPAGYYLYADKRVRYNLARADIIRDYLRRSDRLTPLGLEVRAILERTDNEA